MNQVLDLMKNLCMKKLIELLQIDLYRTFLPNKKIYFKFKKGRRKKKCNLCR